MRLAPLAKLISGIIGISGIISVYPIPSFSTHRFYVAIPSAYGLCPKASHLKT